MAVRQRSSSDYQVQMGLSIDELSSRSGISVETIRYYQRRGLIEAPERNGRRGYYGPETLERLNEVSMLRQQGFSLREIERKFSAGDSEPDMLMSFDELAMRSKIPAPILQSLMAEQVLIPLNVDGVQKFSSDDIDMACAALQLLGKGLPFGDLLELAKVHIARMEETIDDAIAIFDRVVRRHPTSTREQFGEEFKDFIEISEVLSRLVSLNFQRLLTNKAQRHLDQTGSELEKETVERLFKEYLESNV
ncbi:MAG: MerR family transcriptional regulator [Actinomycetota bacterium]|nr:MerR family transcriptional regulator [Actinomycetota bacterium]